MSGDIEQQFEQLSRQFAELYRQGQFEKAEKIAMKMKNLAGNHLGKLHPKFATSLNNLGLLHKTQGNYSAAEPLLRQASEIYRQVLGDAHPHFATSLNNLAALYQAKGDYASAQTLYQQALDITQAHDDKHPDLAASLCNLATLYREMGNHTTAKTLYNRAFEIWRETQGETDPDFIRCLGNMGLLYIDLGDYPEAESLLHQAVEISQKTLGELHPDYARNLNNLGGLYLHIGDYGGAERLFRQAMQIRRKALGETHPEFANSLINLAELNRSMGDYLTAEQFYRQATEILGRALGEIHPNFARNLGNLGVLYIVTRKYAEAESILRQASEIYRKTVGETNPAFARALMNLAALYFRMGEYQLAETVDKEVVEIFRKTVGETHFDFATSLNNLAVIYAATDKYDEALALMRKAAVLQDRKLGQVFSFGTANQRLTVLKTVEGNFETFISLVFQNLPNSSEAVGSGLGLDLVLRRKALAAEALAAQRDAILGGKYPHLEPKLRELSMLRMQIAQKTLAGPGREGLETHQKLLAEWNAQKEKLEQELARQIPEMNLEERLRAADRQAVAKALPEGAALVEFVRFNVFDFKAVPTRDEKQWKPARYLAFVLLAGDPDNVQMIDLGEAERIDKLIAQYRETITGEKENRDAGGRETGKQGDRETGGEGKGEGLRALLFDKLAPALRGRKRLFLAPDGDLTRLPFEVLPLGDGRRLIDEYYISYLSTGRDVLRFGQKSSGKPTASVIAADPDFDVGVQSKSSVASQQSPVSKPTAAPQSKPGLMSKLFGRQSDTTPTTPQSPKPQHQPLPDPRFPTPVTSSRLSRDLDRAHLHFNRLPGTRAEGEQIGGMLGVNKPWFEGDALESSIKQLRSPRILHLATHGFFLQDQPRDLNKERGFGMLGWQSEGGMQRLGGPGMENPLLRSGLALAGANTWLKKGDVPAAAEDGLLTAEDVSGLDLLATELVVLSACDTGLGEIRTGEGVFGLRRAFVLAGAKTLVMSLWKVPDQQTQELMVEFYQRLRDGEPRAEALRNAQLEMKKNYPHPRWWGAFICQGEPGRLEVK